MERGNLVAEIVSGERRGRLGVRIVTEIEKRRVGSVLEIKREKGR